MAQRPNRTPPQRPARPLIPPIDVSDLTTYPLKKRHSKVRVADFARPWKRGGSFEQFFASLPDLLAVKTLRAVATAIATAHRQKRPVIVGIGAHVIKVGLAPLLVDFMSRHPGIAVVADLTNRPVDLVQEGFDMAIRVAPSLDTALIGRKLATTHFRVVASADFLARHGVPDTPEMLSALPALTFSQPAPRLDWSWRRREMHGKVRMTARLASTSADTLRKAAVAGLGVSWLPSFVCGKDIEAGLLVPILEDCDWGSLGVHVLYLHRRFVPSRLRLFIDFLAESLGDDPSGDPWAPRAEDRRVMRAVVRSA